MIRFFHIYLPKRTILLASSESLLIAVALVGAILLWFGADAGLIFRYDHGISNAATATLVCILCMYYYDLYDSVVMHNQREVLSRLIQVFGTVCLILAAVRCVFPSAPLALVPLMTWTVFSGLGVIGLRQLFCYVNQRSGLREPVLLLGAGPLASELASEIQKRPELGLEIATGLQDGDPTDVQYRVRALEQLSRGVRRLILTAPSTDALSRELLHTIRSHGVIIQDGSELYEAITGRVSLNTINPSWFLATNGTIARRRVVLLQHICSVLFAAVAAVAMLPVMLLVAILIRLDSPGPALFRQRRIGRLGKVFVLYKFRSMHHTPLEAESTRPADRNDERFTRVGRWLRRTRLDELPQLLNILRGDMCLIGPRPFTPDLEEKYSKEIPSYELRWSVTPGATGWAQVEKGYCASLQDNREKLSYDLYYIKHLSIAFDCIILFQTVKILLLGRGAQ